MFKVIAILAIGIGVGYSFGWKDAQIHDRNVVERVVNRVGGSNRGKYSSDLEQRAADAER